MFLVLTRMPGGRYHTRLRSLLLGLYDTLRVSTRISSSLVCSVARRQFTAGQVAGNRNARLGAVLTRGHSALMSERKET